MTFGGNWVDKEVVRDRNWVSSRQPSDIPAFNREMLKLFSEYASKGRRAAIARLAPTQRRPVVFAMIGALTEIAATFQAGANFVIYKLLTSEQVVRSLRAGKAFMRADRRRSRRQKLETLVYLQFGIAAMPAMVLDLNEQGISLQSPEPLPPVQEVPLRFVLPGTSNMVEGTGEVIWTDDRGRAGILFSRLTAASRKRSEERRVGKECRAEW